MRDREAVLAKISKLCVGEALVGEGNELAHVDLLIGPRGSSAETAFVTSVTNNKEGFASLLVVLEPNLLVKPATVMFNKVRIRRAKQAVQMFGPAQSGVARAIADCLRDGVIPLEEADDLFICVGVFIHWDAAELAKIEDFNWRAARLALERAVSGRPTPAETLEQRPPAARK